MSKIYPACHLDSNGIKPGSNSKMTDKHTAEHSNTGCLGVDWPVCDVYIAHSQKYQYSRQKKTLLFLQVNFYTSKNYLNRRTLKHA